MLLKLAISFLCGALLLYIMFCLFLGTKLGGGGDIRKLPSDIKHKWFWIMSIRIGDVICVLVIISIITAIPYFLIFIR